MAMPKSAISCTLALHRIVSSQLTRIQRADALIQVAGFDSERQQGFERLDRVGGVSAQPTPYCSRGNLLVEVGRVEVERKQCLEILDGLGGRQLFENVAKVAGGFVAVGSGGADRAVEAG